MKNKIDTLRTYLPKVMACTAFIQLIMSLWYTLYIRPEGAGDEGHFISAMNKIMEEGWKSATCFGISVPYQLLVMPLNLVMPTYIALRVTNLLLLLTFGWYLYNKLHIKHGFTLSIIISYVATSSFYMFGTNDALFSLALCIFFTESYYMISQKSYTNPTWALIGLCLAIFTRELIIVFMPVIIPLLYMGWKNIAFTRKSILITGGIALFLITLNGYSLTYKNRLSYDNKIAPPGLSWTQLRYLTQLEVNAGRIAEGQNVSWEKLRNYLDTYGENSLPKTVIESIFFDVRLTINQYFQDLKSSILRLFRQLGLLLIIPFISILLIKDRIERLKQSYLIILLWLVLSIFCCIIISNIELRWLAAVVLTYLIVSLEYYKGVYTAQNVLPYFSKLVLWMQVVFLCLSLFGITTYSKLILYSK